MTVDDVELVRRIRRTMLRLAVTRDFPEFVRAFAYRRAEQRQDRRSRLEPGDPTHGTSTA